MRHHTLTHGAFQIVLGVGSLLVNTAQDREVFFQPGDDEAIFLDRFEIAQEVAPDRDIALILADIWRDYELVAESRSPAR